MLQNDASQESILAADPMTQESNGWPNAEKPNLRGFAKLAYRPDLRNHPRVTDRYLTPDLRAILIRFALLNAHLDCGDVCRMYLAQGMDPALKFLCLLEGLRPKELENSGLWLRAYGECVRNSYRGQRLAYAISVFMIELEAVYGRGTRMLAERVQQELGSLPRLSRTRSNLRPISPEFALILRGICFYEEDAILTLAGCAGLAPLAAAIAFMATVDAGRASSSGLLVRLQSSAPTLMAALSAGEIVAGEARHLLPREDMIRWGLEAGVRALIQRIS